MKLRTHTCGELRASQVGELVCLCGWVETVRDHGGVIFIDLRDRYGITQVIYDPQDSEEAFKIAESTRGEYVLQIEGEVEARPSDMVNEKISTGAIEVRSKQIRILNPSEVPPFPLDDDKAERVSEDLRLEFRYLDLRRQKMIRNLKLRHKLVQAVRNYLDGAAFIEVETPILSKSTPEGARDYLVPSRVVPGAFYALPQAPQQYKQLLMVAGIDRYFGMELTNLEEVFSGTGFKVFANILGKGGTVKAVNAKSLGSVSAGVIDRWTAIAQEGGLGGLAYIRVQEDGGWKSPIVKFFSDSERSALCEVLDIEAGDLVLFGAGELHVVNEVLGRLRLLSAEAANAIPPDQFAFTWVTEFPLFEKTGDGNLTPMHHPFTSPHPSDLPLMMAAPSMVDDQQLRDVYLRQELPDEVE